MKELPKYIVVRAYGTFRKGDIIQPTGMLRDELKAMNFIAPYVEPEPSAPVVVEEPEPDAAREPETIPETPEVFAAVAPEPETTTRRRNRPKRRGRG